ncbi:hypothetical protein NEOLI_000139 [Neolecta irregularis DAH-3]|uniref:DUF1748-domain-containing protein n=1 Tax=Neolecta irregularis (strain DAH-3) TaxID=1198029 RepID=A0A1U7LR24_NEOID|nr:hypothetical protein NEOLI_000139 [Neolecta irregularis DAH-3]|eukprot:OLL25033.1 hypothetical protein NEOLI_000139 [Neolecta irregularis DAH-3]
MVLGRVFHYGVDAVLVSALLASIKRSTGLQVKTETINNNEIKRAMTRYLDVGEWVLNTSIAFMATSSYFERKQ